MGWDQPLLSAPGQRSVPGPPTEALVECFAIGFEAGDHVFALNVACESPHNSASIPKALIGWQGCNCIYISGDQTRLVFRLQSAGSHHGMTHQHLILVSKEA